MKVAIATDGNSSFNKKTAEEAGIFFMNMPVIIDGENYYQDVNLTPAMFYTALEEDKDVTTSQPAPGDVMDFWDDILSKGYDQIVYIPMSSGLSESCNTAKMLAEDYDGKVEVVDGHGISGTQTISVYNAIDMANNGYDAKKIRERLEETAFEQSIYIAVDTLKYLKKGGRVTPAGAALGTALGIKPILTIQGGKLDAFAKVRGMHKCESKMIDAIKKDLADRFTDVGLEDICMFTAGTLMTEEDEKQWLDTVKAEFPEMGDIQYWPLSLSIGTHIGPGSLAVGIVKRFHM